MAAAAAVGSRLSELLNRLLLLRSLLPEIADGSNAAGVTVSTGRKVVYTAVSLLIFLVAGELPLYGVQSYYGGGYDDDDPHYWMNAMSASGRPTVMAFGLIPLLFSEMAVHLFMALNIIKVDDDRIPQHLRRLDRGRKMFAMLMAIVSPVAVVLHAAIEGGGVNGTITSALVFTLQLIAGGVISIYLDELLRKGYGFLSGLSLFSAANCCACIFWKAFNHGYPLMMMLATLAFFLFVLVILRVYDITLPPVRSPDDPSLHITYTVSLSYMAYAPIIFQAALLSFPFSSISRMLSIKYGDANKVVNLLGSWKELCKYPGHYWPVSGIAYYLTTQPTLGDIEVDPVHSLLYAAFVITGCALLSVFWFRVCSRSKRYMVRLLTNPRRTRVSPELQLVPDEDDSISPRQCRRYMTVLAVFVGHFVGALTLLAGFMGLGGSGPAILLAATVIHSLVEGRSTDQVAAFGL